MSSITISEINSSAQNIQAGDLLLVSKKNNDGSYISTKIDATKLLASCRELDYNDSRASDSLEEYLFLKNGSIDPNIIDTQHYIHPNTQISERYNFDAWSAPYSGLLWTHFQTVGTNDSIDTQTDIELNLCVNGFNMLHWHYRYKPNEPSKYSWSQCDVKSVFINKGEILQFRLENYQDGCECRYINRCRLIPYKYQ